MVVPKVTNMKDLKFSNVPKTVNMTFNPGVVASYSDLDFLQGSRSPRRTKIEHKLAMRSKDILHWTFVPETSRAKLPLATMRHHYRRRWSDAFGKALKANGLDYQGRMLPTAPGQPKTAGLTGTLDIRLFWAAHWEDSDPSKMQRITYNMVKALKEMQGVGRSGSLIRKMFTNNPA